MDYMQGQIHHSLHLGFVCMQATDKHIFSLCIRLYMVFCKNYLQSFALYKCNAIVVNISKYSVLFLMVDFIRQPLTKVLERIKQPNNIHSNDV